MPQAKTDRMIGAMVAAFEAATVPHEAVDRLESSMTNHPKDRHVLAAAVAARAEVIVTQNVKDFPLASCEPFGVQVLHPDDFLAVLYTRSPRTVLEEIDDQVQALTRPPIARGELLQRLAAVVPRFVETIV